MTAQQPTEQDIVARLAELLGVPSTDVHVQDRRSTRADGVEFHARVGHLVFAIQTSSAGDAPAAARGLRTAPTMRAADPRSLPLFVAPYVHPGARATLEAADVSWLDLSGNATITGPGLRIVVLGNPNRFVRRGRPSSVFAPKSSRLVRRLFIEGPLRQRDLVARTGLDAGYVSRSVKRLVEEGLVSRAADGLLSLPDRALVLDAWRDAYDFSKHDVARFSVAARSGDEAMRRLGRAFVDGQVRYAVTGLGAAWLWTKFAGFRTATFFVAERPSPSRLEALGLYPAPADGTVWLVVPNDAAVFDEDSLRDGLRCVHPLQAWLDLKGQPERAAEAAVELRPLVLDEARR